MTNLIADIVRVLGGPLKFSRATVAPRWHPALVISRTSDEVFHVATTDGFSGEFRRYGKDSFSLDCPEWTGQIETMMRRRGYLSEAIRYQMTVGKTNLAECVTH